jgi:hypothetical protein
MTDKYGKIHADGSRSGGQPLNDSIEAKALAMVNEVLAEWGIRKKAVEVPKNGDAFSRALLRAIEQHEAFKQEVSDALVDSWYHNASGEPLERFIIPKPKPDPLVEVLREVDTGSGWDDETDYAGQIHKALEARGLEIREKGQ